MNPMSQLVQSIFSDNSNIMLAAIISLLLVILFVLLLHLYSKWFLAQAQAQAQASRRRRLRRTSVTFSGDLRFHHFHSISILDSPISQGKGLDSAIIAAIPLFLYEAEAEELGCVICLSAFEEGEIGRALPKCGHAFHVECIDMWLNSHSNCPICRAPIVCGNVIVQNQNDSQLGSSSVNGDDDDDNDASAMLEVAIDIPSNEVSESEHGNETGNANGGGVGDPASESSSSLLGYSLERIDEQSFSIYQCK